MAKHLSISELIQLAKQQSVSQEAQDDFINIQKTNAEEEQMWENDDKNVAELD
jgi:hypothetical protein